MRRPSVFAVGENLGSGAALPTPSIEITYGNQKEGHDQVVSFFLEHRNTIDATAFAHSQATGILFFTPQEIALRYETPELRFGDPASESPSG